MITRGKGRWGEAEDSRGRNGEGRILVLGWWTHNAIYRWCVIDLYPRNLYNFINLCHSNKFNFLKKKTTNDTISNRKGSINSQPLPNSRDFPTMLSPASLTHHQWNSYIFLMVSPLILVHKRNSKLPLSRTFSQSFEILLLGMSSKTWLI